MVGKGQPPKKPEDRRYPIQIRFSRLEKAKIEKARIKKGKKFSAFVRDAALDEAENVLEENGR
ncbi:MAG: DUF1778 domain-containing protein [Planctomycetia bacterium]|nr:DUF1778 domain-containing protein [Planctomycetia bacterium]